MKWSHTLRTSERTGPPKARRFSAALAVLSAAALAVLGAQAPAQAAAPGATTHGAGPVATRPASPAPTTPDDRIPYQPVCSTPKKGEDTCYALRRTDVKAFKGLRTAAAPTGYGPADLLSAYNLPSNGGAGQTVAIVDAYDDPTIE